MAVESFRESIRLLSRLPVLWVPGVVAGIFAAGLWLLLNFQGAFFTGRLVIPAGLITFLFLVGMLVIIRDDSGDLRALVRGGIDYYFRVILPMLVILFMLMLVFVLLIVTFGLTGLTPDPGFIGLLAVCVMIPTLMLTFFFDMAAVFEEKKVFESIQRSSLLVSENVMGILAFYVLCALACFTITFGLMMVWEIALYDRLAPLADYNQTQIQTFTFDQLAGMIGPDGIWVTAVVLFLGALILVPLITAYKACFFRKLAGSTPAGQQMTGEYDSKGRWYKY